MEVLYISYIPLFIAAFMVIIMLGFTVFDKALKAKIIARLYKDAPYYQAHKLVQRYHNAMSQGTNPNEMALIEQKIAQYLAQADRLTPDHNGEHVPLTPEQYQQFIEAHRILKKQINFINNDMSIQQRILINTQIKIDCLAYAESFCDLPLRKNAEAGSQQNASQSAMVSSMAKMP